MASRGFASRHVPQRAVDAGLPADDHPQQRARLGVSSRAADAAPDDVCSIAPTSVCTESRCAGDVSFGKTRSAPGLQRSPSSAHAAPLR